MPAEQEACVGGPVDGLDLATQAGEGSATQEAQDLGVAPLAFDAARPEFAAQKKPRGHQPFEDRLDGAHRQAPARRWVDGQEWAVAARPAPEESFEGIRRRGEVRLCHPCRR